MDLLDPLLPSRDWELSPRFSAFCSGNTAKVPLRSEGEEETREISLEGPEGVGTCSSHLQVGKLRLRVTPLPCGHAAQVQRLGLSLLFIDLQVEMCRFDGANPPNPSPSWATITPNAQE